MWRAHDELLDRDVAIKRLHGGRALAEVHSRIFRVRAHREGRVAARLHHPRLAAIYDLIELDGEVCLVMEDVAAPSLADLLDRKGPLPAARVAAIGAQIAEGLAAMHRRGSCTVTSSRPTSWSVPTTRSRSPTSGSRSSTPTSTATSSAWPAPALHGPRARAR